MGDTAHVGEPAMSLTSDGTGWDAQIVATFHRQRR